MSLGALIVVLLVVAAAAVIVDRMWRSPPPPPPPPPARLRTDADTAVTEVNRARNHRPNSPNQPSPARRQQDRQRGRSFVRKSGKRCNCVGFVLGQGEWEIDTDELPTILRDNYSLIADQPVEVCSIIVYGVDGQTYDHIALVVEVNAQGQPAVVRGKAATSNFVYDDPPDVQPYGTDYKIYRRKSTTGLPQDVQTRLAAAQTAYDRIADKTSQAAHDAAEELCQLRNQLLGV